MRDLTWQESASCASVGDDFWFPDKGGSTRDAKRICWKCPVRFECLEDAIATGERRGIRGGLSERERRRLKPRQSSDTRGEVAA